jgi:hypothetical protein
MINLNEKTYDTVLQEASDYFQAQGCSITGEGYKEIATNAVLFESYVDYLTEGASANNAATMAQLMANTNAHILRESSTTGIQPISSLSMPVIRKLWPKFALKEAIDTEVAKSPRFSIAYTKPYMYKGEDVEENRVYLPRGLNQEGNEKALRKEVVGLDKAEVKGAGEIVAADGANAAYVKVAAGAAATVVFDTAVEFTPSAAKLQPLDELVIRATTADGAEIKIGKRLGVYGNGVYAFEGGQLIVQFNGKERQVVLAAIGAEVHVELVAYKSAEYNEESWSVSFEIKRQDIDIPTGQHLNAPLPVEALNDMMALYQIDGTKETVDLMTNVFAMKLDKEILDFLADSFFEQPGNEAFSVAEGYKEYTDYAVTFDCKPAAGFAGSPKAWREELKPLIDHLAQRIKSATYLGAGTFTIVANPIDVQVLENVDWSFRGGNGGNMDGVSVDYAVGTFVGANAYKVVSSVNVPQGAMYLVFTPKGGTQMTYKYYPYAFSVEMGYVDPNRSRVPSIMMTKRHTFQEFMPAIGLIHIENNDGAGYFVQHGDWNK